MVKRVIVLLLVMFLSYAGFSQETDSTLKSIAFSGYLKELPYFQFFTNQQTTFNNILNLRLNLGISLPASTRLVIEMRNRLLSGDGYWGSNQLLEVFKEDNGWLDLTAASAFGGSKSAVQIMADRLFLEHNAGKWQFRLGRQRINWGINMVSNPNDLFNTYSFFDFDYTERPGSDAIRTQYFINSTSRLELAVAPADQASEAVAALFYGFNYQGYDLQLITAYFHDRLALGGGWAGHIRNAGFKGEATLFSDLSGEARETDFVVSSSADYIFTNGLYLVLEGLYNGGYESTEVPELTLIKPLSADNIMFSKFAVTASATYPFSPVFSGSMSAMLLPDIYSVFIAPALVWSLSNSINLTFAAQVFSGGDKSAFSGAGTQLYASFQWSF
ncbi:MAG: hypothetical protein HGA37_09980 [Lentimicrobium sp.]|nr:hypothetical protein [Lentimicrobium sp.]